MPPSHNPKDIARLGETQIQFLWEDGHKSIFDLRFLRQHCPCAMCMDEWTRRPILDPASVPADITATKAELIGNYAIAFQFSDGHATGIFSFENLRKLCPCAECTQTANLRP